MIQLIRGFITGLRTLTLIPMPGKDSESFSTSLFWFPIIGGILGLVVFTAWNLGRDLAWINLADLAAWTALVAGIILTRGLHLDGLSDWGDSLGAIHNRERMLEIMKDSRVGTFGLLSCFTVLLGKWITYKNLFLVNPGSIPVAPGLWIVMSYIVSRTMQVEMAVTLPYARAEGGTARGFVADAKTHHRVFALLVSLVILLVFFREAGLVAFIIGWLTCLVFRWWCEKKIGGVTGDLIGACSELVELTVLTTGLFVYANPNLFMFS
jgi:adenosylcobinamide-GDP ribazoletransferase